MEGKKGAFHTSFPHRSCQPGPKQCRARGMTDIVQPEISPERIRELLDYDPLTGLLTWRRRLVRPGRERTDKAWNSAYVGKPAGAIGKRGAIYIVVSRELPRTARLAAHRVAWAHYHGVWPSVLIDHINHNTADNRIANLREATATQNLRNSRLSPKNTSGVKGVSWSKRRRKWHAYIGVGKRKRVNLGMFSDIHEAIQVRQQAAFSLFGEFANKANP